MSHSITTVREKNVSPPSHCLSPTPNKFLCNGGTFGAASYYCENPCTVKTPALFFPALLDMCSGGETYAASQHGRAPKPATGTKAFKFISISEAKEESDSGSSL